MSTYKYQYGIKEIKLYKKVYEDAAIYLTKPFHVEGTIASVSLESTEMQAAAKNEITDQYSTVTSIEYYVTAAESPTQDQWIPVLPKGQVAVINEKLFINGLRAALRFNCNVLRPITVYKDGSPVSSDLWDIAIQDSKMYVIFDGKLVAGSTSLFTIDYFPDPAYVNPWDIPIERLLPSNVIANNLKYRTDTFRGADLNGIVTLSQYPYLNIYNHTSFDNKTPISVSMSNADFTGPKNTVIKSASPLDGTMASGHAYTKNITEYSNPDWTTKEHHITPYDTIAYPVFEYYQKGNRVCFGETFINSSNIANADFNHGDATVNVTYQYLATNLRVKMILRQNKLFGNNFSPAISEFKLNVKLAK